MAPRRWVAGDDRARLVLPAPGLRTCRDRFRRVRAHAARRHTSCLRVVNRRPDARVPMLTLGEWLCIIRSRAGISRKDLAADLGVPGLLVIRWEGDDTLPNI